MAVHAVRGRGALGNPTPPGPLVGPTAGIGTCRFVYPVVSPTVSLPLRSPEFNNKDRLQFHRISRETRGGTLIVFADPMWPKVETQVLTFTGLSRTQSQALLGFIQAYFGLEVGFVDWEARLEGHYHPHDRPCGAGRPRRDVYRELGI